MSPHDPPPDPEAPKPLTERQRRKAETEAKAEALREQNRTESDAAWRSVAYLISGPLLYGGIGYLLDRWLGTNWLVGVGIVGGMALSLYLIWFRYGSQ